MGSKCRLFLALLPVGFLTAVFSLAYRQDPDFWRSPLGLYESAQEAARRQELPQAIRLAEKSWRRSPGNSDCGVFLGWLYLKAEEPEKAQALFSTIWPREPRATAALKGLAQALERLDRRPEALQLLQDYLEEHPQDAEVLLFAAQMCSAREEDREAAVRYYRSLYRLQPDPLVRRQLVDLLTSLNRFAEAIPLQEEAAAANPQDQDALHRLALLYYWQRDYQAATDIYQRLLERVKDQVALRREAAQAADAAGNEEVALKHYLWLYGKNQGDKEYALKLARLWSRKGKHAEAAAVLAPLMEDQPRQEVRRWYALELLLTGDLDAAHQEYRRAWEAGDTHQETIVNLARLLARRQQFSKAAGMWDEARRRQLIRGELRWEAALTYSYAHRYGDAVEVLKPVERDNPKYPRILLFLGQLHFYQKNWGLAAHYFRAYLAKHPQDAEARRLLAEALAFQPEARQEAIAAYGELAAHHHDPGARLRRISLLLEAGQWQAAEQELKACPLPQDPALLKEQARLCLWVGDMEQAHTCLQACLEKNPGDASLRLLQARVLTYLGRPAEAQEILRRLPAWGSGSEAREVLVAGIEAALAQKDWPSASRLALRLYGTQYAVRDRDPRDWEEARRWREEAKGRKGPGTGKMKTARVAWDPEASEEELTLGVEERTWVARALCHDPGSGTVDLAVDLLIQNLRRNRYHHPSLLMLAHLLPRLPRYEDLSRLVYRLPGIRAEGPEYVAALAFFDSNSGRHGGKLDYLLHVLREYRRHRLPDNPGELLGLAALAMELEQPQVAGEYYRQALRLKPKDSRLEQLLAQCQMVQRDFGPVLAGLEERAADPRAPLAAARLYLMRGQYGAVEQAVGRIPPHHSDYVPGQLLLARAQRLERRYPEALRTLEGLAGRHPAPEVLMEKAQVLEGLGDRRAAQIYEEVGKQEPNSQLARVAAARRARSRENWAAAYEAYAQALKHAPQDVELLNELEFIKQKLRPQLASRGFPQARGDRRPEEALRPWQFSRPDREWDGSLAKTGAIPNFLPESLYFDDSNGLYGMIFRASAAFRAGRAIPLKVAVEFREYNQRAQPANPGLMDLGLAVVHQQVVDTDSRLRRLEVAGGVGPIHLGDRLRLSGELIWRRYWKRVDWEVHQEGHPFEGSSQTVSINARITEKDAWNRLLGALQVDAPLTPKTEVSLRYQRRDIFDQDQHLYPRLYQSVINLADAGPTMYHEISFGMNHQFRPGLEWRTNLAGAWFSDHNRRLTFFQGLTWQAFSSPRMGLAFTPHYYLAAYRERESAYFSPGSYQALGVTVDFYRQIFRLPTFIVQGSAQAVAQQGEWGPALSGLVALEWEPVHNLFINPHIFFFREWVDNYHILSSGLSLRYVF
jgi:tetratricopeptide (TPR) repeat protein